MSDDYDLRILEEDIRSLMNCSQRPNRNDVRSWADRLKAIREAASKACDEYAGFVGVAAAQERLENLDEQRKEKRIEALEKAVGALQENEVARHNELKQILQRVQGRDWEARIEKLDHRISCLSQAHDYHEHATDQERIERLEKDASEHSKHIKKLQDAQESKKCLEFDPKAICDAVDRDWSATKSESDLHWWFESGGLFFILSDEKDSYKGILLQGKKKILEIERDKVIAQMDKMIAEALK